MQQRLFLQKFDNGTREVFANKCHTRQVESRIRVTLEDGVRPSLNDCGCGDSRSHLCVTTNPAHVRRCQTKGNQHAEEHTAWTPQQDVRWHALRLTVRVAWSCDDRVRPISSRCNLTGSGDRLRARQ
jgi:hypothetical protein